MITAGKPILFLIPNVLGAKGFEVLPHYIASIILQIQTFFVEDEKAAKRLIIGTLKFYRIDLPDIDQISFIKMQDLLTEKIIIETLKEIKKRTNHFGVISDAGCPAVADPGARIVKNAHKMNILVKPLVGPSSILLALMASGMNGQQFRFYGYLARNVQERKKNILKLEKVSAKEGETQIFIEAPYRNQALLTDILSNCQPHTMFCTATDLTMPTEEIHSKTVAEWLTQPLPDLHKRPTIFLLNSLA